MLSKTPIWVFLAIWLFVVKVDFAQTAKDTLFFKSGSTVVGEVKRIKLGVITFKPDDANEITVKLKNLKSLYAIRKAYRLESVSHALYYGVIMPGHADGYVEMVNGRDTVSLQLVDISNLYTYASRFPQRFSGSVGFGYNYTRSSNIGRLNFDAMLRYFYKKDEITMSAAGYYTMEDSVFSRDNENISLKYNYYFSPTWFVTGLIAYQRNLELGLHRRYQEGFGVGNKFLTSKSIYAWGRAGVVFNQEKSTALVATGTLAEVFAQVQFNLFRFTNPRINMDMTQTFYYSLSQSGRVRNDGQTNITWEIITDLKLNLGFYNNYDSKPPVTAGSTLDYGTVFGVNYIF